MTTNPRNSRTHLPRKRLTFRSVMRKAATNNGGKRARLGLRREAKRHAALDSAERYALTECCQRSKAPSPLRSRLRLRLRRGKLTSLGRVEAQPRRVPAHCKNLA